MVDVKGFRSGPGPVEIGLGLICALEEECRYILDWGGWRGYRQVGRNPMFEMRRGSLRLRLVVSGMGGVRAVSALRELLDGFRPDQLICFGFAGALDGSLRVGELIWGKGVAKWEEGRRLSPWRELAPAPAGMVAPRHGGSAPCEGHLVSVDAPTPKAAVRGLVGPAEAPAVMEMETYDLSLALEPLGIPLGALRAVSDESALDAGAAVRRWLDDTLRFRPSMLMADLARHPLRIGLLARLFLRSRAAARSLDMGLRALLRGMGGE